MVGKLVRVERPEALPGLHSPHAGFDEPFEMLGACHDRVIRMIGLLGKLELHLAQRGCDAAARQAATDVMRYFDLAAPLHHQDEELHVFPALMEAGSAELKHLVLRLQADHREMQTLWCDVRTTLEAIAHGPDTPAMPLDASTRQRWASFAELHRKHLAAEDAQAYPAAQATLLPDAVRAMSVDMMARRSVGSTASEADRA
ncbi:MAG: hemerythrin domain-containing protein [Pseudomonadota bacterium]